MALGFSLVSSLYFALAAAELGGVRLQIIPSSMADSFVAVVVTVPEEQFSDNDEICLTAGNFVCAKLETHLVQNGHSVPAWIQGGCEEDWGVHFESVIDGTAFDYAICFFASAVGTAQNQMVIQYHLVRPPLLQRLFRKPPELSSSHPIHETMRSFGGLFAESRMLRQSQFDHEY